MDSRLQGLIITIVTIVVTAVAQHFAVLTPTQTRAEANRDANFEARDQLKVCLQALSNEMAD